MNQHYQDIFDKYHKGRLTQAEAKNFQKELVLNPTLQEAYQDYLGFVEGIRQYERQQLKTFLQTPTKGRVVPLHARKGWIFAAAAAVLLLLVVPLYQSMNRLPGLANEYAVDSADRLMGETTTSERENYQKGLQHREAGEYHKALEYFSQVTLTEETVHPFFLAKYNTALVYLQLKDETQAKLVLKELLKRPENHFVKDKAKALLKDLK